MIETPNNRKIADTWDPGQAFRSAGQDSQPRCACCRKPGRAWRAALCSMCTGKRVPSHAAKVQRVWRGRGAHDGLRIPKGRSSRGRPCRLLLLTAAAAAGTGRSRRTAYQLPLLRRLPALRPVQRFSAQRSAQRLRQKAQRTSVTSRDGAPRLPPEWLPHHGPATSHTVTRAPCEMAEHCLPVRGCSRATRSSCRRSVHPKPFLR